MYINFYVDLFWHQVVNEFICCSDYGESSFEDNDLKRIKYLDIDLAFYNDN